MNELLSNQIQLFKSVFKGREDVFAIRWEKEKKSGYMPAYFYDPYLYRAHKMKGGTFQNYNDKTYLKLNDQEIAKHLNGEQLIGAYPLLQDNTSNFIVADFDEASWNMNEGMVVWRPRFEQADRGAGFLCQSMAKQGAGSAGAHDHIVELVVALESHVGPFDHPLCRQSLPAISSSSRAGIRSGRGERTLPCRALSQAPCSSPSALWIRWAS